MDLDHSYLFIQGPPGTGKTYNAAHAIDALLRAGKRVGVSSNSHKAINKLLGEVEKLAAAERNFAATMTPIEALRAWMLLFVDYIAAKHIIAPVLNTFVGGASKLYDSSRGQIQGAIEALVQRAIKSGDIRKDLEPFDLLRALIGVSNVASTPDWQQSAKRLVDILITGSRPMK